MDIWQPLRWMMQIFNMVIDIEFFPGLTFGTITLALLAIVLIFRMIIYPLTGGSVSSAIQGAYNNSYFKKNRDSEKAYQRYKANRDRQNYHSTRYKNERK